MGIICHLSTLRKTSIKYGRHYWKRIANKNTWCTFFSLNRKHKPWIQRQIFCNSSLCDASLWEGNLLHYAWHTSAILKHVKLLGLAEQNHGYLTSLHRIRSDKISDKERRVRKFPTIEMATMLWRHMVIKFDNDPGLFFIWYESRIQ